MKIGFIDYCLNNFHADKFHTLLTGKVGANRVEICAAWESTPRGDDWCVKTGVRRADSAKEVVDACDAVILLAPDNVDQHLALGSEALSSGKPVFVDKNLAATTADARRIIELAAKHGTPITSSSSLRFSVELEELIARLKGTPDAIFSRGFGRWRGYGVHTVAPALRLIGKPVSRLVDTGIEGTRMVTLNDGERHTLVEVRESENQMESCPWQIGVRVGNRYEAVTITKFDEFYENLMSRVVEFFESGQSPVPVEEQFATVAVEEAADESLAADGKWVTLELL